jgi:hypothetical protein
MAGNRYRLGKATRAVHAEEGVKGFVLIPEGADLIIDSLDRSGRLVRVRWESRVLLMFWQDLLERGVEAEPSIEVTVRIANQSF